LQDFIHYARIFGWQMSGFNLNIKIPLPPELLKAVFSPYRICVMQMLLINTILIPGQVACSDTCNPGVPEGTNTSQANILIIWHPQRE